MTAEDRTLLREIVVLVGSLWYTSVRARLMGEAGQEMASLREFSEQGEKALRTFWVATGGDEEES